MVSKKVFVISIVGIIIVFGLLNYQIGLVLEHSKNVEKVVKLNVLYIAALLPSKGVNDGRIDTMGGVHRDYQGNVTDIPLGLIKGEKDVKK